MLCLYNFLYYNVNLIACIALASFDIFGGIMMILIVIR